ncbi:MAG: RNA polymerase sigma factor [Verrucomicrobium sp.]
MATDKPRVPADFHTTRWTRVTLAKADSEDGRRALGDLCDAYYEPVVAYLGSVLRDGDAAREMSHAFFANVLEGGAIGTAHPERGRFRFYLLGAVKHFLSHHREAAMRQKRGGGVAPLSLDAELPGTSVLEVPDSGRTSPEAVFDRQWAITVLARAMTVLTAECEASGKAQMLDRLRPSLLGEAGHGDLAAAAETLGMSAAAVKVAVHRLRQRFRLCVKEEVAGTLGDGGSVEDEMRSLFVALGG